MTAKKTMTYTEALNRIEEILVLIEEGNLEIDELSRSLKEVSKLIQICKNKIGQTETEIDNILQNIETQD